MGVRTKPSMAHIARRILREQQGLAIKQVDMWHHMTGAEQDAVLSRYGGDEKKAKRQFFNAVAALNTTDPHVELVKLGMSGTSEYRWLTNGKAPDTDNPDHQFSYVGQTNDGTPLYRDSNGVVGMLEWQPL